ncbi:MAG TPA: hypothetical protein VLB44_13360 [Kofleriaceae bacterium]|nr:hypothetical protein [Kofleriaceae bacterium]
MIAAVAACSKPAPAPAASDTCDDLKGPPRAKCLDEKFPITHQAISWDTVDVLDGKITAKVPRGWTKSATGFEYTDPALGGVYALRTIPIAEIPAAAPPRTHVIKDQRPPNGRVLIWEKLEQYVKTIDISVYRWVEGSPTAYACTAKLPRQLTLNEPDFEAACSAFAPK